MKSLGTWFQRKPQRAFFLARLLIYVGFAAYYKTVIDPNALIEIFAGLFGVAATDYAGTLTAEKQTVPVVTNNELMRVSAAGQVGAYVAQYATAILPSLLPGATLAKVLSAVVPGLETVLSSALTPAMERRVVDHVHQALRGANLMRRIDL